MRGCVELKIESYVPRLHPKHTDDGQGGYTSRFYEHHALVKVFSFVGSDRQAAFTAVEAYYNGRIHHARLPKHYHPRWHHRIAYHFDWQISRIGGDA